MNDKQAQLPATLAGRGPRTAELLRGVALAILLACAAGRAFMAEMPFRASPLNVPALLQQAGQPLEGPAGVELMVDKGELARAGFAVALMLAVTLWLVGEALAGGLSRQELLPGALIAAFAVWSFISVSGASDQRSAWLSWGEQVALLSGGLAAMHLCRDRRRFVLLVVVLAAVGAALAAKGIYQLAWENPQRVEYFQAHRAEHLADLGMEPGSPKARALADRMAESTAMGFFSLANLLAAALAVLLGSAVGLAAAKIAFARARPAAGRGEISAPAVAAGLAVLAAAGMAVTLLLTRSRGGIGAAVGVAVVAAVLWRLRKRLEGRWRAVTVGLLGVFVLSAVAVVGLGLAKGRLPSKTLAVRWFYWTGSARLVAERPVFGVGPGNFANEYLRVRQAEAEEQVKTPHNVLANAFSQYGLGGGALYLGVLAVMLAAAWRRGNKAQLPREQLLKGATGARRRTVATLAAVVAAVCFVRWYFAGGRGDVNLFIVDSLMPAGVLAAMLAVAVWFGGRVEELPDSAFRVMRLGLAAGATAFVLHNMVSFGLWAPGAAMLFWLAVGAGAGGQPSSACGRRLNGQVAVPSSICGRRLNGRVAVIENTGLNERPCRVYAIAAVVIAAAIGLACFFLNVRPVYLRIEADEQLARHLRAGDFVRARWAAARAVDVDRLDAISAMNAARVELAGRDFDKAADWAERAIIRDSHNPAAWRLSGQILWQAARSGRCGFGPAVEYFARAVALDGADGRLRLEYAALLLDASMPRRAAGQLDHAERINRRLEAFDPTSKYLFSPAEKENLRRLREKTGAFQSNQ